MKAVQGRLILLGLAVIVSVVLFIPSTPLFRYMPEWWKEYLPNKGIILGLDLQGGIHLVLEVESDRAVEIAMDRLMNNMTDILADKKIACGIGQKNVADGDYRHVAIARR